jgi:hypothetical protein
MVLLETLQPALNSLYGNCKLNNCTGESVDLLLYASQPCHLAGVGLGTL